MMLAICRSFMERFYFACVRCGFVKRQQLMRVMKMGAYRYLYIYRVNWSFFDSSIFYWYGLMPTMAQSIPSIGWKTKAQYQQELTMSRYIPARVVKHVRSKDVDVSEEDITEDMVRLLGPNPSCIPYLPVRWILEDFGESSGRMVENTWLAYYPQNVEWMMELMMMGQDSVIYRVGQSIGSELLKRRRIHSQPI